MKTGEAIQRATQKGAETHLPERLRAALREAGLAGQVRVGSSLPKLLTSTTPILTSTTPDAGEGGHPPLDSLLGLSGRPVLGSLIELAGAPSSGRTALAYRLALGATARGELVGWVDLPNALDPRSLRRAGVHLESLLWVRPRGVAVAFRSAELLLYTGFAVVAIDLEGSRGLDRLGSAVWARVLRAARRSRGTVVLLGTQRAAGSFATLALYTERCRARFEWCLFEGMEGTATTLRNRAGPVDTTYHFQVSSGFR